VSEVIERVAKAMAETENPTRYWPGNEGRTYQSIGAGELKCLGQLEPRECEQWRERARAAIEAMHEPLAMAILAVEFGDPAFGEPDQKDRDVATDYARRLIDAALNPGDPS
jgi:hypothetical protein